MANQDGDIEGSIMDALKVIFSTELQTNLPATDKLRLNRLIEFPLQDDPTTVAPYLVYAPAYEIGRSVAQPDAGIYGAIEIGAGPLWRTYFKAVCGTPQRSTRLDAYKAINELSRRVERAVMRHYDLSHVTGVSDVTGTLFSGDQSEFIDAMNPEKMWTRTLRRVYGGDSTFFGEALMLWSYNFRRPKDW